MAGVPNTSDTSPKNITNSPFLPGAYCSTSSSPPKPLYSSQATMATDVFAAPHSYSLSPIAERKPIEKSTFSLLPLSELEPIGGVADKAVYTVFMRKLPRNTGNEALRSMLLFAKDLIDVEFVPYDHPEDKGLLAAVARFKTLTGANEAKEKLHGKALAPNDAKMVVEVLQSGLPGMLGARRNTVDGSSTSRHGSASTASSTASANRQSSRFNGTFQSLEKMSPPNGAPSLGNGDFPVSASNPPYSTIFSPQSPIGGFLDEQPRNVGKSVINDNAGDDDELLKDPVAYAARNNQANPVTMPRRPTNPQVSVPTSRFASLSLSTPATNSMASPPAATFSSPRSVAPIQSPTSALSAMSPHSIPSAGSGTMGPSNYQIATQFHQRHNYPPVNPADQNPPCNTLYVGNLPIDTSEDELKAMFSKQRGYKRLCFRTKQNGPMCFVEFEDVSFATKALNELYGQPLHNSVKGGIRLSFSKNPLGVRSGQNNNVGPPNPMTPQGALPGMPGPTTFSTATGPPPGLAAPPGLAGPMNMSPASNFGMYGNGFGMPSAMSSPMRAPPLTGGIGTSVGGSYGGMGSVYSDYMMGR